MPKKRSKFKMTVFAFGLVLFIVGLALGFNVVTLAFVLYDTTPPNFGNVTPPATSVYSPTPLTAGSQYKVSAYVTDTESSVKSVKCAVTSIEGQSYSTTLTLQYSSSDGVWSYSWTVPSLSNTKLKFDFTATDEAGNSRTKTTYGLIGIPDGYFSINGQQVDQNTVIVVSNPTLNFEFTATNLGSAITNVVVKIKQDNTLVKEVTLSEVTADQKWSGSYTLPSQGKYQIDGLVWVGVNSYQKMSLLMTFGSGGFGPLTMSQMIGIATALIGVCMMAYGAKP
jgi:hypothetical protein